MLAPPSDEVPRDQVILPGFRLRPGLIPRLAPQRVLDRLGGLHSELGLDPQFAHRLDQAIDVVGLKKYW